MPSLKKGQPETCLWNSVRTPILVGFVEEKEGVAEVIESHWLHEYIGNREELDLSGWGLAGGAG